MKKNTKKIDITVNVTAHNEGLLLYKTLQSVMEGIIHAESRGLKIQFNISLDNPDNQTILALEKFNSHTKKKINIYKIDLKDLGLSRNFLIKNSQGKYIVFFDGDDFFTENYLYSAFYLAEKTKDPAIFSPRYLVCFEGDTYITEKLDSTYSEISKYIFETNYFISQNFVHRSVYEQIKYETNTGGYGMEDWHFASEALALGFKFYNVPNTIFFYRRKKKGSLLANQVMNYSIPRRSILYTPAIFASINSQKRDESNYTNKSILSSLKKVLNKLELTSHYLKVQYVLHKNIYASLKKRAKLYLNKDISDNDLNLIPERLSKIGINEETIKYWGKINSFEPLIHPSKDLLLSIPIVEYPKESITSDFYYNLCKDHQAFKSTDLVLVPHLVKGGADLAAINLIKTLSELGNNVIVFSSLDVESPWMDRIKNLKNVIIIESYSDLRGASEEQKINFIIRMIINWDIKRISIINAEMGYKIASRYNKVINGLGCRVFLHTYAFDMTKDGYIFNFIPNGLIESYDGVFKYITDSDVYRKDLMRIHGFGVQEIETLSLPVNSLIEKKVDYSKKNKILWAGRIGDDKLVDVMVNVGKKLSKDGIKLIIKGEIEAKYKRNNKFYKMIKGFDNIIYEGQFNGFNEIDIDSYDMLLFTSKNEGMPNIILESCMANLYIISPKVGGVQDCILNHHNGTFVENKFESDSYYVAIKEAYSKKYYKNKSIINEANTNILKKHTQNNYAKSLKKIMELS